MLNQNMPNCDLVGPSYGPNWGRVWRAAVAVAVGMFVGLNPNAQQTAAATAMILDQSVAAITITSAGSGYAFAPAVSIVGGEGSGAAAFASVSNGAVIEITVSDGGSGYTGAPNVVIEPPPALLSLRRLFLIWLAMAGLPISGQTVSLSLRKVVRSRAIGSPNPVQPCH